MRTTVRVNTVVVFLKWVLALSQAASVGQICGRRTLRYRNLLVQHMVRWREEVARIADGIRRTNKKQRLYKIGDSWRVKLVAAQEKWVALSAGILSRQAARKLLS